MRRLISVVLPCLNEEGNLPLLVPKIIANIPKKYEYEIICVDDGSSDETPTVISNIAAKNRRIKGIILYKKAGHQKALQLGIRYAEGDAVIMMDADFQHPPEMIPKLINRWEAGHDLVRGRKKQNGNTPIMRRIQAKIGYYLWSKISGGIIIPGASDFRLVSAKLAEYIKNSQEENIFIRGLVNTIARNPTNVIYGVGKRRYGTSSYSLMDLTELFISGLISFSPVLLRVAFIVGVVIFFATGMFLTIDLIYALIIKKKIIEGWLTSVFLTFLVNSLVLMYLGVLGEYIGIIFREVKNRPAHLIDRTINISG